MKTRRLENHLDMALKEPAEAAVYLNAVSDEGDFDALLLALSDVTRAHGMTAVSKRSGVRRDSLYKMLCRKGNPGFSGVLEVLRATGLRIIFDVAKRAEAKETAVVQ